MVALLALPSAAALGLHQPRPAAAGIVIGGQPAGYGLWALPFAQSSSPLGPQPLATGDLVFDAAVTVYLLYSIPGSATVVLNATQYVPVTVTVLENQTQGGNTTRVPVQVTEMTEEQWSSMPITVSEGLTTEVIPLPATAHQKDLLLRVGSATWGLSHLTPAADTIAGAITAGGIEQGLAEEAILTGLVMLGALWCGRVLARRIRRVPPTGPLWPVAWIGIPTLAYFAAFVPTSQALGGLSPLLYPILISAAAFPYLARLWSDHDSILIQGFQATSEQRGIHMAAILPAVRESGQWRPAPETWREALWWAAGRPTEALPAQIVGRDGVSARSDVEPPEVRSPLPGTYRSGASRVLWYSAAEGLARTMTHLEWHRVKGLRFPRLRVVAGALRGKLVPPREPIEYSVGVRSVEEIALASQEDHLLQVAYRARVPKARREYAEGVADLVLQVVYGSGAPRSDAELRDMVRRKDLRAEEPTEGEEAADHDQIEPEGSANGGRQT